MPRLESKALAFGVFGVFLSNHFVECSSCVVVGRIGVYAQMGFESKYRSRFALFFFEDDSGNGGETVTDLPVLGFREKDSAGGYGVPIDDGSVLYFVYLVFVIVGARLVIIKTVRILIPC